MPFSHNMSKNKVLRVRLLPMLLIVVVSCAPSRQLTVIDSGHTSIEAGAISCTGKNEVDYNDDVVSEIAKELNRRHRDFVLTRTKNRDIVDQADRFRTFAVDPLDDEKWERYKYLYSRIAMANAHRAALFISIHHDSVQERHLMRDENGKIIDVCLDFKKINHPGYTIFVANDPAYPNTIQFYQESLKFAEILAKQMQAIGRRPSTYHENLSDRVNYEIIDPILGIYNSKSILAVLRNALMPAVLMEVGVIVDVEDEITVSSQTFKEQLAKSLAECIDAYFDHSVDTLE